MTEAWKTDPSQPADNRHQRRLLCSDLIRIRWTGSRGLPREEVAVLEDYSKVGGGLFLPFRIDEGASITLHTEWESFGATVRHCAWRDNGYLLGIEFHEPRPDGQVYLPDHLVDLGDLEL